MNYEDDRRIIWAFFRINFNTKSFEKRKLSLRLKDGHSQHDGRDGTANAEGYIVFAPSSGSI
jgi:hypothetical protein